ENLAHLVPGLDPLGVSLFESMLVYDPQRRISAKDAMEHPYFDHLSPNVKNIGAEQK
ncbi:unnamed protein product, partial [Discosporangium mesarthrocarpum]